MNRIEKLNYIQKIKNMNQAEICEEYIQLKNQLIDLQEKINYLKEKILSHSNVEYHTSLGTLIIKTEKRKIFDSKKFQNEYQDLYNKFLVEKEIKKIVVKK